jgi:predicted dehydrogenase
VWQTGSQQRSDYKFRRACELVRNGRLGKILKIEVGLPTGGRTDVKQVTQVPEGLDWDWWLGPAPWVPYRGVCHWNWRWIMDYSGGQLTDWAGHHIDIAPQGAKWYGERGWIHVNRGGLRAEPAEILKEVIGPGEIRLYESRDHKQDFLDCVRSRKLTICPAEVGHRSISVGLLGEIAMLTGRKIKWNPDTEQIIGDEEASALLGRSYREPWVL